MTKKKMSHKQAQSSKPTNRKSASLHPPLSFFKQHNPTQVALAIFVGFTVALSVLLIAVFMQKSDIASINQTVKNDEVSLRVISTTEVAAKDVMTKEPVEGKKGLLVKLEVQNKSDQPQAFLPVHQIFLKSRNGYIYQLKPISYEGERNSIVAGELQPGETIEGDVSFMIDPDVDQLWLNFDSRWNNTLPLLVQL